MLYAACVAYIGPIPIGGCRFHARRGSNLVRFPMMTRRGLAVALVLAGLLAPLTVLGQEVTVDPSGTSVTSTRVIRSARRAFTATIPALLLKDQPLGKVMDQLRDDAGANISVDWKTLEGAGVTKDTLITLSLYEVSLGDALGQIMSVAHPSSPVLTYIDFNVIHITTQAEADKKLIVRTYNVKDLTSAQVNQVLPPRTNGIGNNNNNNGFNNNQSGIPNVTQVGIGATTTGIQQQGNQYGNQNNNNNNNQMTNGQLIQQAQAQAGAALVNLVKAQIRPDIWSDGKGGGGPANITFYNGTLVVTAPVYVQEAIGGPVPGH